MNAVLQASECLLVSVTNDELAGICSDLNEISHGMLGPKLSVSVFPGLSVGQGGGTRELAAHRRGRLVGRPGGAAGTAVRDATLVPVEGARV